MPTIRKPGVNYRFSRKAVKESHTSVPVVKFSRGELETAISSPGQYAQLFGLPEKTFKTLLGSISQNLSAMERHKKAEYFFRFPLKEKKELMLKLSVGKSGQLTIRQVPVAHTITATEEWKGHKDPYESLKNILKIGFRSHNWPNARFKERYPAVNSVSLGAGRYGDSYRIEMLAPFESNVAFRGDYYVQGSAINQISGIIVELSPLSSAEQKARKKKMYLEELKEFGLPVKFVEK